MNLAIVITEVDHPKWKDGKRSVLKAKKRSADIVFFKNSNPRYFWQLHFTFSVAAVGAL